MIKLIKLFKDKEGNLCPRKIFAMLFAIVVIISWIGQQFFNKDVPEFMFNGLVSILKQILI